MTEILKRILIGFGAVAALGVAAVGYFAFSQLNPSLPMSLAALGQVRLTNEAGSPIRLSQAVTPHAATLIAFWATWCGPCRSEAREIASLRQHYRASELNVLYLNVDEAPNAAATAAFLRAAHAGDLPVLYAGHSGWKAITGQSTMAIPRSYIFDRTGTSSAVFSGFDVSDQHGIERSIAKVISG